MKKKYLIILLCLLIPFAFLFTACDQKEIIDKVPQDYRFTESYSTIVTEYERKYDWLRGQWVLMPNTHTVIMPDTFEIYYKITYKIGDDIEVEYEWEKVTKFEYEKVVEMLGDNSIKTSKVE